MPGYHIRTASGIQAARDWYVRIASAPSSTHSMVAATSSGGAIGYGNGAGATGTPYGSLGPLQTGNYQLRELTWATGTAGNPTIVYMAYDGNPSVPADDDGSFSTIQITGVFADSAGALVTRTLTRSARSSTSTSGTNWRQWQFDGALAAQFITGNAYTVTVNHATVGGSAIARVREAYVRTASGIQRYWPPGGLVSIANQSYGATSSSNPTCGYRLMSTGGIERINNGDAPTSLGAWISPTSSAPGSYRARATLISGTINSGNSLNTWHAISGTPLWACVRPNPPNGSGTSTGRILVEIDDGAGTALDNADITLSATIP